MRSAGKILLVRNANAYDFGGGERYSIDLGKELVRCGMTPLVATAHESIKNLASESGIDVVNMPWLKNQGVRGWRKLLILPYLVWQLRLVFWYIKTIIKYDPLVLHLQGRDDFISGTIAGKIMRRRVIWTDHADLKYIFQNTSKPFRNPVGKMVRICSRWADAVIVVSKSEKSLIGASIGKSLGDNFGVVYNGISDRKVVPIRKYPKEQVVFAATSRLVKSKGLMELVAASKKLNLEGHNIVTVLLGEGPERKEIEALADESVIFSGFPENYLSVVAGADIFVHPSHNEGFSLSLVEAAMLSMPVIATDVGGNPEIISDKQTGLLVPPNDEESLYAAMLYAIENRDTMKIYGASLRKQYESKFQLSQIVNDVLVPLYNGAK